MNKNIRLSKEEKNIINLAEKGKLVSVKNKKKEIGKYSQIAKQTLRKNKTISIRISEVDLLKLKAKAIEEGVPYQTLISSSLHKMVNIKDKA